MASNSASPPSRARPRFISKSKYLAGRQCAKLLWHHYNAKDLIPETGTFLQAIFDQGHAVGELAKQLFPNGLDIGEVVGGLNETIRLTGEHLTERRPLFEASFAHEGGYCRVDVLNPVDDDAWDIIEVKSTSSLKDVHLDDLAIQNWILTGVGLKIRKCILCHINSDFVRKGEIDLQRYFTMKDATEQVSNRAREVGESLEDMFQIIGAQVSPEIPIGRHCDDPYTCPLHAHCWDFLPESSVMDLYRGEKKGFELLEQEIVKIEEIPAGFNLSAHQSIQRTATRSGKAHIDRQAIGQFLETLQYPLYFLDFETCGSAIPLFDGTRPYQQLPFQFSCHKVARPGGGIEHRQFLAEGREDPRLEFMKALEEVLSLTGSIVVYNASFEKTRLKECAAALPTFAAWVDTLEGRFVDLLVPFRSFHYYHPGQAGSASMKAVLPSLTGQGYEELAIQEGGAASREFLRITHGQVSEEEMQQVRRQLEDYCAQDTEGMIWILEKLQALLQPSS